MAQKENPMLPGEVFCIGDAWHESFLCGCFHQVWQILYGQEDNRVHTGGQAGLAQQAWRRRRQ